MRTLRGGLKPIPEKEMSEWARIALYAYRHAIWKKRMAFVTADCE